MFKQKRKSGFTLLELLVVVIIVSILAAVALPQFGKMTKRAKTAEGVSTIGTLLTAQLLYYQEHEYFATVAIDLMVEYNTINFSYATPNIAAGPPPSVTMVATGRAVQTSPGTNVTVIGTIESTGKRTITVSGL